MAEVQPPLLAPGLPRLPRVLFRTCLERAPFDETERGCGGLGLETSPETLIATSESPGIDEEVARDLARSVNCPVLVLHGDQDAISPHARGAALAEAARGTLVTLEGSGHLPHTRDPVRVNLLLRDFLQPAPPPARWRRGKARRRRALYISSPIGLGHAQRDVAIADELRKLHPDLEIDWLAQHPVTAVLKARGERIHPASGGSRDVPMPVFERLPSVDHDVTVQPFMQSIDIYDRQRLDRKRRFAPSFETTLEVARPSPGSSAQPGRPVRARRGR